MILELEKHVLVGHRHAKGAFSAGEFANQVEDLGRNDYALEIADALGQVLTDIRQPATVGGYHDQLAVVGLEIDAVHEEPCLIVGDGEGGLRDHGDELILRKFEVSVRCLRLDFRKLIR